MSVQRKDNHRSHEPHRNSPEEIKSRNGRIEPRITLMARTWRRRSVILYPRHPRFKFFVLSQRIAYWFRPQTGLCHRRHSRFEFSASILCALCGLLFNLRPFGCGVRRAALSRSSCLSLASLNQPLKSKQPPHTGRGLFRVAARLRVFARSRADWQVCPVPGHTTRESII